MYISAAPNAVPAVSITPLTLARYAAAASEEIDPHHRSEQWSSFIGIITAIVGNILISFALNTQRYAHTRLERQYKERKKARWKAENRRNGVGAYGIGSEQADRNGSAIGHDSPNGHDGEEEATETDTLLPRSIDRDSSEIEREQTDSDDSASQSYLRSPYWWTGIILMIIGEAGNFLAYGFAPASIVSPLGVVALISNCMIAPFMLKEPFRGRDFFGVLISITGAVTVVLSANTTDPKLGPDELLDLMSRLEFKIYLGITTAMIFGLMWVSARYGQKSIFVDLGLVGLFGGYTALSTKGVASLLSYTLFRALTFPMTYLLVFVLILTAVMQIRYVNRALQRFDATQVIPTQFVMFTLSVIIGSAVLYRDFERTSGDSSGKFIGGCALTFMGVWLITSAREPREEDDGFGFEEEEEEHINLARDSRRPSIQQRDDRRDSIRHNPHASLPMSLGTPTRSRAPHLPVTGTTPALAPPETIEEQSPETLRPQTPQHMALHSDLDTPSEVSSIASTPTLPTNHAFDSHSPLLNSYQDDSHESSQTPKRAGFLHPLTSLFTTTPSKPPFETPSHSTPSLPTIPPHHPLPLPRTPTTGTTSGPTTPTQSHPHPSSTTHGPKPRRSLTNLLRHPPPLSTPLSSSLSAVVADELRRGPPRPLRRRHTIRSPLPAASAPVTPNSIGSRSRGLSTGDINVAIVT
ncbi:DUF803-domain-containing protein [Eremomyces bilateralis CBS 781.70]|uniref:DUF803-domain-containing protein n=1 Tax=Eremomyces bilateralis CBS 781.70 TaxID=1392243 RepID=A0A6G1G667_9PEZI|nr:DUF803-domain-containing protein [Eremomyces bilateralis CBS 781.70]KAF1813534.1 DUF803-domain-containing protein [Eremomyces bilateralis CBS 781.70]